jgi:hypothetical protein
VRSRGRVAALLLQYGKAHLAVLDVRVEHLDGYRSSLALADSRE